MTEEGMRVLWAVRLEGLRRIEANVEEFQECDQCRAISPKRLGLCPWCRSYRFKTNTARVRATLKAMATRPWPLNAGVVPRVVCGV